MFIQKLSNNEKHAGFTHVIQLTPDDLTEATANTEQVINTIPVVAGNVVERVMPVLITPFKDASDAAYNSTLLEVGDAGDDDRYLAATQLNENGSEVLFAAGTGTVNAFTAAGYITVTFGSMAAKSLSDIDVGEVHIYVRMVELNLLREPALLQ